MGCTPSKSAGIYNHDPVCRDLDTCSTFVPSIQSSVSTPERPRLCVETSSGKQTFLSVPCRDVHGRSVNQSSCDESWSPAGSVPPGSVPPGSSASCPAQSSMKPRSQTPELLSDSEGSGTA